ncbi:hypothetical protein CPB86DRAFT_878650 [Serendipita vermifera]|nr:hypothetical protein CPB86DRAFT_878650 [Serendipita vermifera]
MSFLVLKDTTIELSSRDDCLLKQIDHLILEVSVNGQTVDQANLLSQKSDHWKWRADQILLIPEIAVAFTVSVFLETNGAERQMIGSMELDGLEICNAMGDLYEIPLMTHENYSNLILKTRAMPIDDIRDIITGNHEITSPEGEFSSEDDSIGKALVDASTAYNNFKQYGDLESLELSIMLYQSAVEVIPEDHPILPDVLNNLAASLLNRFEQHGCIDDVNKAIDRLQLSINLTPDGNTDKPSRLSNLGNAFSILFQRTGNLEDLSNAIHHHQTAVNLTSEGDSEKSLRFNNLGGTLQIRFKRFGEFADLEDSITQLQKAVNCAPDTDPNKLIYLSNLGAALHARFQRLGSILDIDNSVEREQAAVNLTPNGHPDKPTYLNNLGISFYERFQRLGNPVDIDNAIKQQERAVFLAPDDHLEKPMYLNNLATSLDARFQRFGNISDINNAISRYQASVKLTLDGHPAKPARLTNFGTSLNARFERLGNVADINAAIDQEQRAVDLTQEGDPFLSSRLSNLGNSLQVRFTELGDLADIKNAIMRQQQALDGIPIDHRDRPAFLVNLANSHLVCFRQFHLHHDAEIAISHYSVAAMSLAGPPTIRFKAVESWISTAYLINHGSLLNAYECALGLMPLMAWLGLTIGDRHQQLVRIGGIARDAAAAAITAEQYEKALEWLEQGRSIVWTQILRLRTPVDQLQEVDPDLAERLLRVSRTLDRGIRQGNVVEGNQMSIEEEGRRYRASTAEWESIIEQIRSLPNFENFLRSPSWSQLKAASHGGPVVVFNIAKTRCDALALLPGLEEIIHIPLPKVTSERVTELQDELKDQLYSSGIRSGDMRATMRVTDETDGESCRRVLADLWTSLVKPVLDSLAFFPHPDTLPRIWWCATGPLAFLPIHAAGIYGPDSGESQLCNYVISSYTPTLSTLLDPVKSVPSSPFSLLSVIQSSAPGASSIPNTRKELEHIRSHLSGQSHVVLEGPAGTKRRVMEEMKACNWLHLACHGIQTPEEPTKSALLLEDGHLTLEEIIKLDLPQAEFAFLSACQTTTGDETLSEEAVHIAGGMLLAGYRGVVATMWSIQDGLAPMLTDEFYGHIMKGKERPDPKKAAEALHLSVQKLRKRPGVQFTDWVPFVHLGI